MGNLVVDVKGSNVFDRFEKFGFDFLGALFWEAEVLALSSGLSIMGHVDTLLGNV